VRSEISGRVLLRGAKDAGPTLLIASLGRGPRWSSSRCHLLLPLSLSFFLDPSLEETLAARKVFFSLSFFFRRKVWLVDFVDWYTCCTDIKKSLIAAVYYPEFLNVLLQAYSAYQMSINNIYFNSF
jgi:hypothetical protein